MGGKHFGCIFAIKTKFMGIEKRNPSNFLNAAIASAAQTLSQDIVLDQNEMPLDHGARFGWSLGDFSAEDYGSEYMSIKRGELLKRSMDKSEDQGWVDGFGASGEGWFPATFWQEDLKPEEVCVDLVQYSQRSMSDHFRDGRELEETIAELL